MDPNTSTDINQQLKKTEDVFRNEIHKQDFYKIRSMCLKEKKLWEDPEFQAVDSSLFLSKRLKVEWKRPSEITTNPQFFVGGASCFYVNRGKQNNSWFLSAVANLTRQPNLFNRVVPDDQGFGNNYAGIFHFKFWQYGDWVDIVVDDQLPTLNGKLVFVHSRDSHEFWSALLEKAYAKVCGSYQALDEGKPGEAMVDFTGGLSSLYKLSESTKNVFQILLKAFEINSLVAASVAGKLGATEQKTPEGLLMGHTYSVTRVQYITVNGSQTSSKIAMIRLRNPWGDGTEYVGPWSVKSPEWQDIPESERQKTGLIFEYDGEFWMSYEDFQKYFFVLSICYLSPDSLTDDALTSKNVKQWQMYKFHGTWSWGVTAGGCRNHIRSYANNPQYRIKIPYDNVGDKSDCRLIIGLMQKNKRLQRLQGYFVIGFCVYMLNNPDNLSKPLNEIFFKENEPLATSKYINCREVASRLVLPPGDYCIVPSTFKPNQVSEFLIRVLSELENYMEEMDSDVREISYDKKIEISKSLLLDCKKNDARIKDFFCEISGDDKEVSWIELKNILDFTAKNEKSSFLTTFTDASPYNKLMSLTWGNFFKASITYKVFDTVRGGFSKDVCRALITMQDSDHSGKLNFEEFNKLWDDFRRWQCIYQENSKETQGVLISIELGAALSSAGFKLNNEILNTLVHRYKDKDDKISFDDFLMCGLRLESVIDCFKKKVQTGLKNSSLTLQNWLNNTLRL